MTDTKPITDGEWTLHYTIGDIVTGPVYVNDVIMTAEGNNYTVRTGNAPKRVNATGDVTALDSHGERYDMPVRQLGLRWKHAGGGLGG